MRNIPPDVLKKIQEEMCRPEGTVEFDYVSETLFDTALPQEVILELAAGAHVFQLVRNERLEWGRGICNHSSGGKRGRCGSSGRKNTEIYRNLPFPAPPGYGEPWRSLGPKNDSVDSLFARADQACYQAKRQGKNRFCLASS